MIDIKNVKYTPLYISADGKQYNIKGAVTSLNIEDNENELAKRSGPVIANIDTDYGKLSDLMELGGLFAVTATDGNKTDEVYRGKIKTWMPDEDGSRNELKCTTYDDLIQLSKSYDSKFFAEGRTTKSILQEIATDRSLNLIENEAPDVAHGKTIMSNKSIAKMIEEILDDAVKRGGYRCVMRMAKGGLFIKKVCGNTEVYVFKADNSVSISNKRDISDLVTRVKVLGKENKSGIAPVEAVVDGKTEYGIIQKIYKRDKDESIDVAKSAAQEILDEDGQVKEECTLSLPDIPFVQKGDMIYCDKLKTADGYYEVLSVQHDCIQLKMTVKVKKMPVTDQAATGNSAQQGKSYAPGTEVIFNGGTHYVASDSNTGYTVKGTGKAKITKIAEGAKHPYHLIHSDNSCNVYGWVDSGTFS